MAMVAVRTGRAIRSENRSTVRASAIRSAARVEQLCQINKAGTVHVFPVFVALQTPREYHSHSSSSAPTGSQSLRYN